MRKYLVGLVIALGSLLGPAQAATIDFKLGETEYVPGFGFEADYAITSVSQLTPEFSLAAGESQLVDLLKIECSNELCAGAGTFDAKLNFLSPAGTGPATSTAFAFGFTLFERTFGTINWLQDVVNLTTANGSTFRVLFHDLGFVFAGDNYVVLQATIEALSVVPLPGAAILFGSALLGAGLLRRKSLGGRSVEAIAA